MKLIFLFLVHMCLSTFASSIEASFTPNDFLSAQPTYNENYFVLKREGGSQAVENFRSFLNENLPFEGDINLTAQSTAREVKSIRLTFKNKQGLDIKMQFTGFDRFEIRWKLDDQGNISHCTYKVNDQDPEYLAIDSQKDNHRVRVKYNEQH